MGNLNLGIGRIDYEEFPRQDLAAVHIWIPALEPKPKEGWLFNDGALTTSVTWFWGMDLKVAAEVYLMEYQCARSNEARAEREKDPSKPIYPWRKPGNPPMVVHAQTEDGVVHVFDVSEEWHVETTAKERRLDS